MELKPILRDLSRISKPMPAAQDPAAEPAKARASADNDVPLLDDADVVQVEESNQGGQVSASGEIDVQPRSMPEPERGPSLEIADLGPGPPRSAVSGTIGTADRVQTVKLDAPVEKPSPDGAQGRQAERPTLSLRKAPPRVATLEAPQPAPSPAEKADPAPEPTLAPAAGRRSRDRERPTTPLRRTREQRSPKPGVDRRAHTAITDVVDRPVEVSTVEQELEASSPKRSGRNKLLLGILALVVLGAIVLLVQSLGDKKHREPRPGVGSTVMAQADGAVAPPRATDAAVARQVPPPVDAAPPKPKVDPEELNRKVAEAQKLLKKRKAKEAIALLEGVLARDRGHAGATKALSEHYASECLRAFDYMKFQASADFGRKAVSYRPKDAEVWVRIGWSLVELKQKTEARFALRRALELCPKCQWASFAQKKLDKLK
jgi:hypothetical protein